MCEHSHLPFPLLAPLDRDLGCSDWTSHLTRDYIENFCRQWSTFSEIMAGSVIGFATDDSMLMHTSRKNRRNAANNGRGRSTFFFPMMVRRLGHNCRSFLGLRWMLCRYSIKLLKEIGRAITFLFQSTPLCKTKHMCPKQLIINIWAAGVHLPIRLKVLAVDTYVLSIQLS